MMQYLYSFVFHYPLLMAFVLVFGGLIYHSRTPIFAGAVVALGVISYSLHLWYFVVVPVLAILVIAAVMVRSRRLVANQSLAQESAALK